MKTTDGIDYRFNNELYFRHNFSFLENDFRIKQIQNQNFIVPWQMNEEVKKEEVVENY